jgi:hypothetical protein
VPEPNVCFAIIVKRKDIVMKGKVMEPLDLGQIRRPAYNYLGVMN